MKLESAEGTYLNNGACELTEGERGGILGKTAERVERHRLVKSVNPTQALAFRTKYGLLLLSKGNSAVMRQNEQRYFWRMILPIRGDKPRLLSGPKHKKPKKDVKCSTILQKVPILPILDLDIPASLQGYVEGLFLAFQQAYPVTAATSIQSMSRLSYRHTTWY